MIPRPTVIRRVAASAVALVAIPPARKQSSQSQSSSSPADSAATAKSASASGGRSAVKMTPSFVTRLRPRRGHAGALPHRGEQVAARLLAAAAGIRADPAVLVMLRVPLALVAATLARLRARFDDCPRHGRVVFGLPAGHSAGGDADVGAVEVEANELRQHLHVPLGVTGERAQRDGLSDTVTFG